MLIAYYTRTDSTKRMAEEIGEGAERLGVKARMKRVEECTLNDLVEADGIVIGSPTYFGNVAWQVKKLIDESHPLYKRHQLELKVGGCFTSSGLLRDAKDCIRMLEVALAMHKMKVISGIIRTPSDREEDVSQMCQQYGMEIAKEIL